MIDDSQELESDDAASITPSCLSTFEAVGVNLIQAADGEYRATISTISSLRLQKQHS